MKKQLFLRFFSEICDLTMDYAKKIVYLQPIITL